MLVDIKLNGKSVKADITADMTLYEFVREHGCYSVKCGCETSNCGLCTVFLNDKPVLSDQGAEQCGFCNPGFVMNALALFRENPYPDEEEIKEFLSGNLCRCSGYEGQLRGIMNFLEAKKAKEAE